MFMKTSILINPKELIVADREIPELGDNDVLVRVDCVGICGTDVSVYRGDYKAIEGVTLGHEYNGVVSKIGKKVSRFNVDDHVVSQASWGCGRCHWCAEGYPSYCESPQMLGRTINGSLAQYIVVPESILLKINKNVSSLEAQATVGVATALRALDRANLRMGEKVLIIGPGYSAMIMLQLCKLAGAIKIGMLGTREERLNIALDLGADFVYNSKTDVDWHNKIQKETEYQGYDLVIEASGTISGLVSAVEFVRKGGRIVQFGTSNNNIEGIEQKIFYSREISLIGTKGGYGFYNKAVELLEEKRIKIDPLITHKLPLSEVARAFEIMDKRLENVLRVAVFCNED